MNKSASLEKKIDASHHIPNLRTFKKIRQFEQNYKVLLIEYPQEVFGAVKLFVSLSKCYQRMTTFLKKERAVLPAALSDIKNIMDEYERDMAVIHRDVLQWLSVYIDCCLDDEDAMELVKGWRYKRVIGQVQENAQAMWARFAAAEGMAGVKRNDIRHIFYLRKKSKDETLSPNKRYDFNQSCVEGVRRILVRRFKDNFYRLRHRFETILFSQAAVTDIRQVAREEGGHESEGIKQLIERVRQFVHDCLYGYTPPSEDFGIITRQGMSQQIAPKVRRLERIQLKLRLKRGVVLFMCTAALAIFMRVTGWDGHLMNAGKSLAREVAHIVSLLPEEKNRFFEQQILNFNDNVTAENLQLNLRNYNYGGLHRDSNRVFYFSEYILRNYLILLAKGESSQLLDVETQRAAFLLDHRLVPYIEKLGTLYQGNVILEADLREIILGVRRILVAKDVYPFMFLVLSENTPYIFLYSERILSTMPLLEEDVESLGIDTFWFDETDQRRLQAYYMVGDNYPFRGKAGFFEGEFAVVFTSLSARPKWTAWHELGHVVDYMEFTHAGIMVPENIEINGVLFPLIFAEDNKTYLNGHVFFQARKRIKNDYYVQSAKGILNGAIIFFNDLQGTDHPLISNRFEESRIALIEEKINKLDNEQLSQLARVFFQNPVKYLSTAEKAKYRSVETNAEQVIYGVHGSPQREVIELRPWGSLFSSSSKGPRFIREGAGGGDDSAALRRAAIIRAIIAFILFELTAVLLHLIASPLRIRKFFGRKPQKIVDDMFKSQSHLLTKNRQHMQTAKHLLDSIYDSTYDKGEISQRKIDLFRLTSNNRERFFFHAGLSLAPIIPRNAVIKNEFHLLLFYLPFIGPYAARQRWIFPRQRAFYLREKFNRKLRNLLVRSPKGTSVHVLSDKMDQIMKRYELPHQHKGTSKGKHDIDFEQIEQWVASYLDKVYGHIRLNYEGRWMDLSRLNKAMDRGSDFDRLDQYIPGDDIRQIDWNVTARSPSKEAMVRKRVHDEEIQVAFLFDMTTLDTTINRKKWAADLAKSIRAVGENNHLKSVILLYPSGQHTIRQVKLHSKLHYKQLAAKVLQIVKNLFERSTIPFDISRYNGLIFYSQEENQRYRQQLNLLSYDYMDQQTTLKHVKISNHTIFMIGVKPQRKKVIARILNKKNKAVFW